MAAGRPLLIGPAGRIRSVAAGLAAAVAAACLTAPAAARDEPDGFALCEAAIAEAEQKTGTPPGLLAAIGAVESGRDDGLGRRRPWPWSINAAGAGQVLDTKEAAVEAVRRLQAGGVASIDVGCLQVNLAQHARAFATLEEALDPRRNAAYAAGYLKALEARLNDPVAAAGAYHSFTSSLAAGYASRVLAAWGEPPGPAAPAPPPRAARPPAQSGIRVVRLIASEAAASGRERGPLVIRLGARTKA